MADKNFGPQYLTSDGRFTKERPDWMRPKGSETPSVSAKKNHPTPKLSEGTVKKVADVLHIMLNDK
jgi:hypothetical protein